MQCIKEDEPCSVINKFMNPSILPECLTSDTAAVLRICVHTSGWIYLGLLVLLFLHLAKPLQYSCTISFGQGG